MTYRVFAFATASVSSLALGLLAGLAAIASSEIQAQGLRPLPSQSIGSTRPAPVNADPQRPADFIVAIVNSEPITQGELRLETTRLAQQLAQARRPAPSNAELTKAVLERMINDKAQLQVARDTGIRIDDAAVDVAETNVAQQNRIDVPELRRRLRADGLGLAQFREQLRDQLTLTRIRERDVDARVRVSDAEVDQFVRNGSPLANAGPLEINIAQILVAVADSASPAQVATLQAKAQSALTRARAGEDFAALARELSDSPDRANGGQLGLRTEDRLPPLFITATQNLAEGAVSDLQRSGAGFHILKVIEKRSQSAMTVMQSKARHILLRSSPDLNEAQAREKLNGIKRRIEAGQATFEAMARENSQDGSAPQGGELGWTVPGQLVPEFEAVLNTLSPGQISDPLISRFGMHLIQLSERRTVPMTEREQREAIRSQLREKKLDEAYIVWAQDVRGRAYVELRDASF